jgi:hypothetical protein
MKKLFLSYLVLGGLILFLTPSCLAQYPPPAGMSGTTAIYKDSSVFIGWAKTCTVVRGYIDIADTTKVDNFSNRATYGADTDALGKADLNVVSLGDGGTATLTFDMPLGNDVGPDFAVFENGLSTGTPYADFLELAFVEVSSDGVRYVRFPSTSLTQTTTQVQSFGTLDARNLNNLAGKYVGSYGTPFDLEDLKDSAGINLNWITHIRIIDVVGTIAAPWATHDSHGNIINDPFPTPFYSGGFDLDAIGVIHYYNQGIADNLAKIHIQVYPNPVSEKMKVLINSSDPVSLTLIDASGRSLMTRVIKKESVIDLSFLSSGIYFGKFRFPDGSVETKKVFKQ